MQGDSVGSRPLLRAEKTIVRDRCIAQKHAAVIRTSTQAGMYAISISGNWLAGWLATTAAVPRIILSVGTNEPSTLLVARYFNCRKYSPINLSSMFYRSRTQRRVYHRGPQPAQSQLNDTIPIRHLISDIQTSELSFFPPASLIFEQWKLFVPQKQAWR